MLPQGPKPPPFASTGVPSQPPRPLTSLPLPRFKATKDTEWRRKLQARRKIPSEASSKETDVGGAENSIVDNHHRGNEKRKSIETQTLEEKESSERGTNLAEALAAMTEKHLGIDVLDQGKEVSTFVSYLLDTIQILERQVRYLGAINPLIDSRSGPGDGRGIDSKDGEATVSQPQGSQVVHRICCSAKSHEHDGKLYEDEPVTRRMKTPDHPGWLHAESEIFHLETWASIRPLLCFIIIREHRCAQDQRSEDHWQKQRFRGQYDGAASARLEKLIITSSALLKALKQVAEFSPNGGKNDFSSEMEAPYLFLFHHRKKLEELSVSGAYRDVILPLTNFLKERYEAEYAEAEEMILQGYINDYHIPKLFKPNQMLLMKHKGEPQVAFILEKFSPMRGEIYFHGWRWDFNGHDLERTPELGQISMVSEEKTKIRDLVIHPIEFAREEDVQILSQRGIKFWGMRDQVYTCYTGWDRGSKQKYVGKTTFENGHVRKTLTTR
ncbi:uncharacterized protein CCOS01_12546 [Colletotrichum costaricense]|uniref:DUF7025 domain-containing protein n=1 Tax=Colletotrichum costaricense TaxID=1209916 RepID=A0AAJ0DWH3_9PEZI|nr:uncharacterized protein CCOS01_12546 [Colletotrichum costaricense]KAK1516997.1 hypothetical protein CCOS01_12546 [Colletotrichum costaricense]